MLKWFLAGLQITGRRANAGASPCRECFLKWRMFSLLTNACTFLDTYRGRALRAVWFPRQASRGNGENTQDLRLGKEKDASQVREQGTMMNDCCFIT